MFGGILLNHTCVGPLRLVGKALHIISSGTLEGALWSWRLQCGHTGHAFHHTNPMKASWTWKVKDDYWWKLGESVRWTKSSTWFVLLMFSLISSIAFLIWSISFSKRGTLRDVVPLEWFSCSTFSPSLTSWLWAYPSTHLSWRCLLWFISRVNSWFWWVSSAMVAAMDCICWTESGCMTGAD